MVTKSDAVARMLVKKIVRFYQQCDAVWSVNNATADVLREYGYKGEILVVENGTNREPLNPDGVERLKNRVTIREDVPTTTRRICTGSSAPAGSCRRRALTSSW